MDLINFLGLTPEKIEVFKSGGYFVMFIAMVMEGPFVTLASAFLASLGIFDIYIVAILGWLGDTVGDIFLFLIGKFHLKFIKKTENISEEKKENLLHKIMILVEKNFFISLIFIKYTPYAPMIALPYLGNQKNISFTKFTIYTAILSLFVPIFVAVIGYNFSTIRYWISLVPHEYQIPAIIFAISVLIILAIIIIIGIQKIHKKFFTKVDEFIEKEDQKK